MNRNGGSAFVVLFFNYFVHFKGKQRETERFADFSERDQKMKIKKPVCLIIASVLLIFNMSGCSAGKEKVVIYTSMETYRLIYMNDRLREEFPQYDITLEYVSTGNHAAKLLAEGTESECDITYDLEYGYMQKLDEAGILADIPWCDTSVFLDEVMVSDRIIPEIRSSGSIIINEELLKKKGLKEPESYEDLLKPEYKNLISMPNPKASGTGYMFLKSLVNSWGEERAFAYFDELTPNILQYTSSGAGPLNAVLQGEAAIGLGMTAPAVVKINEGSRIKLTYFEEGLPYSLYGQAVIKGKETKPAVREVFDFLVNTFLYEHNEKFFPEKIFKEQDYTLENYPEHIRYSDMSNNTVKEKECLLKKWKY